MKQKKLLIYILAILLALTLIVAVACDPNKPEQPDKPSEPTGSTTPDEPEIVGISVSGAIEAYVDEFSYANYSITVFYSDKTTEIVPLAASYLSVVDQVKLTTAGSHTVTVTYEGVSTQFSVLLRNRTSTKPEDHEIVGISVNGAIEVYVDEFSYSDYSITVFYSDKTTESVPLSANYLSVADQAKLTTAGMHTMIVTYEGVSAPFSVLLRNHVFTGVTLQSRTVPYNGQPQSLEVQNLPQGAKVDYVGNGQTNVGVYTVKATVSMFGYDDLTLTSTLTIEKATYDMSGVTFTSKSVAYNGKSHSLEVQGELPNGVTVEYVGNGQTNAGSYTVTAKFSGDSTNYNAIPDKTATLTITRATRTVTFKQDGQEDKVVEVLDLAALPYNKIPTPAQPDPRYVYSWDLTGIDLTCITSDITVNAVRTANVYKIIYYLNGGENNPDNPSTYTCEDTVTLHEPLAREDCVFGGWYGLPNFSDEAITEIPQGSYGNVVLYAKWISPDGLLFAEMGDGYAVTGHDGGDTDVIIPSTFMGRPVVGIARNAFANSKITSITISESVISIDIFAFENCGKLQSITVASGNTVYVSVDNCLIEIETKTLILGCENSVIPTDGSVTSIYHHAFCGCLGLTSISIPSAVTSIGCHAFRDSGLQTVTFGENSQLQIIDADAFHDCIDLTSIAIPSGVTTIGMMAFSGCSNLQTVTFEEGSHLQTIDEYAFYNCASLTSITIPSSVITLDLGAFMFCRGLQTVTFEEGSQLQTIGQCAFYNCSSLTSIKIPSNVTVIGTGAFAYCSELTSVTILEGVTSIQSLMFLHCSSLTSIVIPSSVTSIRTNAFYQCSSLQTVYYSGTAEQWAEIEIGDGNESLTDATVYCYSATPEENTWHFDSVGVPTLWKEEELQ